MSAPPPEAIARPALSFLWGARVQRVDRPTANLFALTLYDQGEKRSLIFSLTNATPGVGLVPDRPQGEPASAFVRRLRVAIENARFSAAHWLGGDGAARATALSLSFLRGGETTEVVVDFDVSGRNLYLIGPSGHVSGAAEERVRRTRFPGPKARFQASQRAGIPLVETLEQALGRGSELVQQSARSSEQTLRSQASVQIKAALKRLQRKAAAIGQDVERANSAPLLRREANLLLCQLAEIRAGAMTVELLDIARDPPETLTVTLDPALSAQQNAQRRFTRARRLERGISIARERLAQTEAELAALSELATAMASLEPAALVAAGAALGIKIALPNASTPRARGSKQTHTPYRVFHGSAGAKILVGKGAEDNDTLTLTVARPHDLWLHARGLQGAHVIIARERGAELAPALLLDAAHLAAHFSSARGEASAEIQYAERRHVRKAKGSAPGAVRVDRERVLLLRVDLARLKQLLASESVS